MPSPSRQYPYCTAAVTICATRDRDLLEATEYSTDCNEIWHVIKPHPANRQYFTAEQISCNTHHFPFSWKKLFTLVNLNKCNYTCFLLTGLKQQTYIKLTVLQRCCLSEGFSRLGIGNEAGGGVFCLWSIVLGQATVVGLTHISALLWSPARYHAHIAAAGLGETSTAFLRRENCTKGKHLRWESKAPWHRSCWDKLQQAGPKQQAVPKHRHPKKENSGKGGSRPREQPSWKPGCSLEADQRKMVGDDHLVNQLDLS